MNKLTIYDDPDYGWTVEESSGYVHPCPDLDEALKQAKSVLTRYEPLNADEKTYRDFDYCYRCWSKMEYNRRAVGTKR